MTSVQGTTTETTTTETTTTAAATTTAPPPTTTVATQPTTTAPPPSTSSIPSAPPSRPASGVSERSLQVGCPVVAVVLLLPRRSPLFVGAYADTATKRAEIAQLVYRAGGGIVTGSAAAMSERNCGSGGAVGARVAVSSLSLLDGAVTAGRVTLMRGSSMTSTVTGLRVHGVATEPRAHVAVPGVGYLTIGTQARVSAGAAALALHLTVARAGLPAGTVVLVASVGLPAVKATPRHRATKHRASHKKRRKPTGLPLTVTPPLALRHYTFPVAGPADYGDSYGGLRTDVPGNWHHGDDIFAALGTPVVAVSDGTLNRVGWERLGGWRLWVRDAAGDEFYYAHLSGYAPADLQSNRVRAGQVIGFVGNTGDAITTPPHLHFEIHPRSLLHLAYNGAVDPTTYLEKWTHLARVVAPRPAHPPFPTAPQLRNEARHVFRQLLVARHLAKQKPLARARTHVSTTAGAEEPAVPNHKIASARATPTTGAGSSSSAVIAAGALALLAGSGVAALLLRQRRIGRSDQS
jgi:murein DD-endopeptidase MepM/ murein hydrolase activator NlpD